MGPESAGERLTAAYLRQRRWEWEFEPTVSGRNLDFRADTPVGPVLLEVYEPELRLPSTAGAFDSIQPVIGAFVRRKRLQVRAAKEAGLPLVMVIGSERSDVPYGLHALEGAMFGRPGVTLPVGSEDPGADARFVFLGGGRVQPEMNRGVSALAAIRRFNPSRWRLDAAWRSHGLFCDNEVLYQKHRNDPGTYQHAVAELHERMWDIETDLTDRGVFDPSAAVARLVVLHNPFAINPLDLRFGGPHDEQHGLVELDERTIWTQVTSGILKWEVPT